MNDNFLLQFIIYLSAAVLCVPLARRLGLGSVLGYLTAGIIIGPFIFGFIGREGESLMHFAEFGVVMMLFLIGLELDPKQLWKIRKLIAGVGFSQVAITSAIFFIAGLLLGFNWQTALGVSLALSMSSTAIVLQSLKEKGLMKSTAGQGSFGVLLFQDIAVIPILALLPVLAFLPSLPGEATDIVLIDVLPRWAQSVSLLAAVVLIIAVGRYGIVPMLRIVAKTRLRELFTAAALLIVIGIAYIMMLVGLSPALGTFLGGVVLANSEFRHELESDLEPFKGLLLGLFFMAVGASINFNLIMQNPLQILLMTIGIMTIKSLVLLGIGKVFGFSADQNFTFSLGISQVGEFAFVLLSFMLTLQIISPSQGDYLMAVTALSMTFSPLLILLNEKLIQHRFSLEGKSDRKADLIEEKNAVIIAGFSHFGSTVGRFLRANGTQATILDNDPDRVELLRKMGFKVYYGDASRVDLLEAAGARDAKILVVAMNSPEVNLQLTETVKKHFPHLELMMRAKNRDDAYDLMDAGIKNIYREHLDTSVRLGVDVLKKLGRRAYTAFRSGQNFIRYDEAAMEKLYKHRHDLKQYIANVREQISNTEALLQNDSMSGPATSDHAWDSESMRESINRQEAVTKK